MKEAEISMACVRNWSSPFPTRRDLVPSFARSGKASTIYMICVDYWSARDKKDSFHLSVKGPDKSVHATIELEDRQVHVKLADGKLSTQGISYKQEGPRHKSSSRSFL